MMTNSDTTAAQAEGPDFNSVPADFPRPGYLGSLAGVQPKLAMVEYEGRFYLPGATPPEVYSRWDICEDLAKQFARKSVESKAGKRAHMTEEEILAQYLPRLIAQKWTSEPEARWIMRRTAEMLGWPVPQSALET
jgi:hypothetical protein